MAVLRNKLDLREMNEYRNVLEQDVSREKQMELEVWMKKNECDVCAINETGLSGN